jgi:Glycosyl transferase family 2
MGSTHFSFAIPSRAGDTLWATLAEQILEIPFPFHFEILVVSNGSLSDEISLPAVRVIENVPGRLAYARWTALLAARAPFVFFLDDDVAAPSLAQVMEVLRVFADHPHLQAVGGSYSDAEGAGAVSRSYNFICNSWIDVSRGNQLEGELWEARNLLGGCLCVRSDLRELIKPPPLDFDWGGEDTHLMRSLSAIGKGGAHIPSLRLQHAHKGGISKIFRRGFRHGWNSRRFGLATTRKHFRPTMFSGALRNAPIVALHFSALLAGKLAYSLRALPILTNPPPLQCHKPSGSER